MSALICVLQPFHQILRAFKVEQWQRQLLQLAQRQRLDARGGRWRKDAATALQQAQGQSAGFTATPLSTAFLQVFLEGGSVAPNVFEDS